LILFNLGFLGGLSCYPTETFYLHFDEFLIIKINFRGLTQHQVFENVTVIQQPDKISQHFEGGDKFFYLFFMVYSGFFAKYLPLTWKNRDSRGMESRIILLDL